MACPPWTSRRSTCSTARGMILKSFLIGLTLIKASNYNRRDKIAGATCSPGRDPYQADV